MCCSGPDLPYRPWHERKHKIVSRYMERCPRDTVLQDKAPRTNHDGNLCARQVFHALNHSDMNSNGVLDVGAYGGGPDLAPFAPEMNASEQAEAKFALNLDGTTYPFRLRHLLEGLHWQ